MTVRDLGASVRQRLLNQARMMNRPFQELLQYYAMERFLYRLANSPHRTNFILKGALLLTAWRAPMWRPTMDIDLAGRTSNDLAHVRSLIRDVCAIEAEPDGLRFDVGSVEVFRINEDADYEGVRVTFQGTLARARVPMQVDIGFGDVIVPEPSMLTYPTLLDFPAPVLCAYARETVVAEKLEALTYLGLLNSRLKDYFDIKLLAQLYPFNGKLLVQAVTATFGHRKTVIQARPSGLTAEFSTQPAKRAQWLAFLRRNRITQEQELNDLVSDVSRFASPALAAAAAGEAFDFYWAPGGAWSRFAAAVH